MDCKSRILHRHNHIELIFSLNIPLFALPGSSINTTTLEKAYTLSICNLCRLHEIIFVIYPIDQSTFQTSIQRRADIDFAKPFLWFYHSGRAT